MSSRGKKGDGTGGGGGGGGGGKKRTGPAPTVEQIQTDIITKTANMYWAPFSDQKRLPYNAKVIDDIYKQELLATKFASARVMLLEFSQYLENYLWPNFNPRTASKEHIMSIVIMVNEKFSERVPAWEAFKRSPDHFGALFHKVMLASLEDSVHNLREQTVLLRFVIHCFNSLEEDLIREQAQRLVSLAIWSQVLPGRREEVFKSNVRYRKVWNALKKKDGKMEAEALKKAQCERSFLAQHVHKFYKILDAIPAKGEVPHTTVHYCERFLELMVDLTAQLPTRRFFNLLMDDAHVVVKAKLSTLVTREDGKLFVQLLEVLKFYAGFEINEQTGEALTDGEMIDIHYNRITSLQKACFKHFREELETFALANVASIDTRDALLKHFSPLSNRKLHEIAAYLNLVAPPEEGKENVIDTPLLLELLVSRHERRPSQLTALNEMPLYPTEEIIWDENIVPLDYVQGDGLFALPKLNLQFLTLHDYLLRNFNLFRLESTYEIRQDIEDAVSRMRPWMSEDGSCYFGGWARMAQPVVTFNIVEVAKPNLGENHPARVRADVTVNLNLRNEIKSEWEGLRKHDVAFLITVKPPSSMGTKFDHRKPFIPQVGLMYVRGCEIEGMLDENGRVIEEGPEPRPDMRGESRTYRVWLDPNQYQQDMTKAVQGHQDVYETFNIIMRRKPKENNFKAVLETIRDLMNTKCVVPDWLHDLLLGYSDPGAAHYSKMDNQIARLDWNDTFLDEDHLRHSFPEKDKRFLVKDPSSKPAPPFIVKLPDLKSKRKRDEEENDKTIVVEPHIIPNRGPYPYNQPKKNAIPFTPTQIEAVKAGMQPGLTMVVGPPGTGKTDVAVQIISNLYHNFPTQRTLIVTHSNQALNQLFEKIMALDIDERHLLRLGHGEEALETEKDFSRYGRVNYVLQQRLELLGEVDRLQKSLGADGDVSSTCETAAYFFLYQVLARWEEFLSKVRPKHGDNGEVHLIKEHFPFLAFFANAPQPMFKERTYEEDWDIAEGCFRYIKKIFEQLEEFQAFELLRSGADRTRYLLVKEAKIIAMTCTHAALKRRDLVQMGFEYDNILMEESAQILEIETFIPLLLQSPVDNHNRLKRWIMIGDHHQLPPVIKNMAFKKYSNMEQSLFTRFVRLQVPTVDLDAQGRARSSLANLYNWRYKNLGNLPHIDRYPEFKLANAGFFFDFQLIDVGDFNGIGESEPNPYFYQNLAEAEYLTATFMYMRLLGYPAHKISVLTTYNGQKHLIRDVIKRRCGNNPLIGQPHKVTTVDRFQGQQNDYILLSLVRTRTVGHLRDVRRLVVAMSRARLGLYIFGRVRLFQNCFELTPAFNQLTTRPLKLHLAPMEAYPGDRKYNEQPQCNPVVMEDMPHMAQFVFDYYRDKVQNLARIYGKPSGPKELSSAPNAAGEVVEQKQRGFEQGRTEEHPGVDSDESDEEEDGRHQPNTSKQPNSSKQTKTKSEQKATTPKAADGKEEQQQKPMESEEQSTDTKNTEQKQTEKESSDVNVEHTAETKQEDAVTMAEENASEPEVSDKAEQKAEGNQQDAVTMDEENAS